MADKPECKYAESCYRKNEEHRRKFKHPDPDSEPEPEAELSEEEDNGEPSSKRQRVMTKEQDEDGRQEEGEKEELPEESDAAGEGEDADASEEQPTTPPNLDIKEELRLKFKVEMPQDFFDFWDYCKSIDSAEPFNALQKDVGIQLSGPFDVLAGKLKVVKGQRPTYVLHHRFFYDPPEFQTVLLGDENTQHHLGYYRDEPKKAPVFVASNSAKDGCTISPQGENLFAAVKVHIDGLCKKTKDGKRLAALKEKGKSLTEWAKKCNHCLDPRSKSMKARDKKVVTKTFHKAGIVVPLDSSGVGYRELPETDGSLKKMLKKIVESESQQEKDANFDNLQEIITLIQFANDECDYGEGYELGIDLFSFGHDRFHSTVEMLLSVAYQLLGREEFGEILSAHLKDRQRDNVSRILK